MRDIRYLALLLAVSLFLFYFGLGDMALTDPDESFYAETAREMVEAKEWMTPLIFGQPQFEKPIFYYWLVVVSYLVFGVSEFAARFPSVIFGILGVFGVYLLGRFLFSSLCGLFSGLVLATCTQYIILSRACVTDIVLTVFILYCILFFIVGWTTGRRRHFLAAAVMAALAVLTKGPIGLFIPGIIIAPYILFTRQWRGLKNVPISWCLLVFLAVSMPWYIAVTLSHGNAFINEFFGFHNVIRFLEPEHRIGSSPFFYIPVIIGGFFPWSLFLPLGAWNMYKEKADTSRVKASGALLLIWFLAVFVFFSISRTKLVTYIFPLFPVLALVAGRFWERFVQSATEEDGHLRKWMDLSYIFFVVTALLALVGIYILVRIEYPQALMGAVQAEAAFLVGLILSVIFYFRGKWNYSFFSIVLTTLLLLFPLVQKVLPVIEEYESSKAISLRAVELVGPQDLLGGESDHRRGIAFYAERTEVVDIHPYPELLKFISLKERVWGIIQKKHYDQLKGDRGKKVSDPIFQSGEYVLFTNKPLEEYKD